MKKKGVVFDTIVVANCLDILPTIPSQSVDAVITDPPYPHIKRDYGYWTVEEWWALIVKGVIPEVRRILKPTGSAVFILQPNSEKVGKMRGWLWEFMAWVCREWNMVQDVWWWHRGALPLGGAPSHGLLRPSLKACVWCGDCNCYRKQDAVLESPAPSTRRDKRVIQDKIASSPSGRTVNRSRALSAFRKRGGVTPHNVLIHSNQSNRDNHSASTPLTLADWWTRYIVPPGGVVVDPFMGSGTMAVAAVKNRCHFFGCDTKQDYVDIANKRIAKARLETAQMELDL